MSERIQVSAVVPASLAGGRLDQAAAQLFPDYSRSRLHEHHGSQNMKYR